MKKLQQARQFRGKSGTRYQRGKREPVSKSGVALAAVQGQGLKNKKRGCPKNFILRYLNGIYNSVTIGAHLAVLFSNR